MPIMLYIFVVFVLLIAVGFFWFLNSNQQYRAGYELGPMIEKEFNLADMFLREALRSLEVISEKAKWLLFIAIFLLLIEFFIFVAYFIENSGAPINLQGFQHLYFIAGLVYFFVLLFAVFLSIRILTLSKEIPSFLNGFNWQRPSIDSQIQEMDSTRKKQLSFATIEKRKQVEQNFTLALVLISVAVTILLVFASRWLFIALN